MTSALALQEPFHTTGQRRRFQAGELLAQVRARHPLHGDTGVLARAEHGIGTAAHGPRHQSESTAFAEERDAGLGLDVPVACCRAGVQSAPDTVPSQAPRDPGLVVVGAELRQGGYGAAVRLPGPITTTSAPARLRYLAAAEPNMPAPTTTTSACLACPSSSAMRGERVELFLRPRPCDTPQSVSSIPPLGLSRDAARFTTPGDAVRRGPIPGQADDRRTTRCGNRRQAVRIRSPVSYEPLMSPGIAHCST